MKKVLLCLSAVLVLGAGGGLWFLHATPQRPVQGNRDTDQGDQVSFNPIPMAAPTTSKGPAPTDPIVDPPTLNPNLLTVNIPTVVVATVSIPDPTLNPTSVQLLRVNANGSTSMVANMGDDGKGGDQKPGDKVFTATLTLNESQVGVFGFQVSAVFRGSNQIRSISQQVPVLAPHVNPVVLPPDPGEAGKGTLAGIDSDHDGVRDDVQRYIIFKYPQSEKLRQSLLQAGIGFEAETVIGGQNSAQQVHDAHDCLGAILMANPSDEMGAWAWRNTEEQLQAAVLNTPARAKAFIEADNALGSAVIRSTPDDQRAARCTFNPSTLPN